MFSISNVINRFLPVRDTCRFVRRAFRNRELPYGPSGSTIF
jgi:hypothetical protein